MPTIRPFFSNFTRGEISPYVYARSDLGAYYNGLEVAENVIVLPEGGARRRAGTRVVTEVKDTNIPTILIPFSRARDLSYIVEAGARYMRFYKDNQQLLDGTAPVEVATSYADDELKMLQWVQSIDVLFLQHENHGTAKLSSVSDQQWTFGAVNFNPPPSIEDSPSGIELGGGTLHLSATTGTVTMHTDNSCFITADAGRDIVGFGGLYRGLIISVDGPQDITVNVIGAPWIASLAIGNLNWQLSGSPVRELTTDIKDPLNAEATLITSADVFRPADVGKFVRMFGGTIWIQTFDSAQQVKGIVVAVLNQVTTLPATAPAGAWTLESSAWSSRNGYPATIEFHQGRLVEAATPTQPTTVWGSATDNFENFALGTLAADSYAFTVRSGKANPLTWLTSVNELLWGESDYSAPIQPLKIDTSIRYAQGPGNNEPIGGATIPYVGSSKGTIYYVHSTKTEIRALAYDIQQDGLTSKNLTILGRHLFDPKEGGSPIKQAAIAYAEKRDSVIYLLRDDGQLIALTIYEQEQVTAFTRLITDGSFESVAVIPKGTYNQVWVIVRRTVNGVTKRFIEIFEDSHELLTGRKYHELVTDCASVVNVTAPASVFTGFNHLIGKTVDVIWHSTATAALKSGNFLGQFVVDGAGQVTLPYSVSDGVLEIGLRFTPRMKLVRPASPQQNMEGIPRKWNSIWARIKDTNSLTCNGENFQFVEPGDPLDEGPQPKSMDVRVIGQGWSTDNELIFSQSFPGPMTLLGCFGSLQLGAD